MSSLSEHNLKIEFRNVYVRNTVHFHKCEEKSRSKRELNKYCSLFSHLIPIAVVEVLIKHDDLPKKRRIFRATVHDEHKGKFDGNFMFKGENYANRKKVDAEIT